MKSSQRFQQLSQISGQVYREQPGRKTFAAQINDEDVFVKLHLGVGWKEIIKNLVLLKKPVLGACDEHQALTRLHQLNIATLEVIEFGETGCNPATRCSYLVTRALKNTVSLETLCEAWLMNPPAIRFKRQLIFEVARMAALIHKHGINHRDFYICHFLLDESYYQQAKKIKLYLIDLHRAQIRAKTPWRWQIKDIAGLYFSALRIGLTRRDFFYFIRCYEKIFGDDGAFDWERFWFEVELRAWALYEKTYYRHSRNIFKTMWHSSALNSQFQHDFFNKPDELIAASAIVKEDKTTTVAKYVDGEKAYIIKRYNARTLKIWLKRFFKMTRARRCWLQGMRLNQLGIHTPEPLAMLNHRLANQSYLVTEFLEGEDLAKHLQEKPEALMHWVGQVDVLFKSLAQIYTAHGDMKATNLWCHQHQLFLLDLDGMSRYCYYNQVEKALAKDRKRFLRNWQEARFEKVFQDAVCRSGSA